MSSEPQILINCSRPGLAYPVVTGDAVVLAGWALAPSGVERVEAIPAVGDPVPLAYGERAAPVDVSAAYPGYPDAPRCGYEGAVPVASLPEGRQTVLVRVTGRDGHHSDLAVPIEVDRDALATGRLIAFVDRPMPGPQPAVVSEGYLGVRGWALSTAGIERVEAVVDGVVRGRLRLGMLRPDVPRVYPEFPEVEHSGFVGLVPVTDLPPGNHTVTVRVRTNLGEQWEAQRSFTVAPSTAVFGQAPRANAMYGRWLEQHEPTEDDLDRARKDAATLSAGPRFLILLPLNHHDPAATIASLRNQVYPRWDVAFVSPAGADLSPIEPVLDTDDRFHLQQTAVGQTAADLANAIVRASAHDYVAVLDPRDRLSPLALLEVAKAVAATPAPDLVYVDHDAWSGPGGIRWDPAFKPDWAPDLHLSLNYLGDFVPVRRNAFIAAGGFRGDLGPAARYDLALRLTDGVNAGDPRVLHLPRLLHSRLTPPPEAGLSATASRPADDQAEANAVHEALGRRGVDATVEQGLVPGTRRVRHPLREHPPVTVVMPTGGKLHYLRPCLESILSASTYPDLRILVVDNSGGSEVAELCEALAMSGAPVRREPFALAPFNFSAVVNHALPLVDTPYLILMNDDMTVVAPDWVEAMLEHAQRPEIGAVGARLLYPDQTIQHTGVIFGPYGGSTHPFRHFPEQHPGYFQYPHVVREWSAVTFACAMLRTSIFDEVGPLDDVNFRVAFNDADVCLRIRERGYRIVSTPWAVLYHYESATKIVLAEPGEVAYMRERWGHVIDHDPFYNPNLSRIGEDYSLNLDGGRG